MVDQFDWMKRELYINNLSKKIINPEIFKINNKKYYLLFIIFMVDIVQYQNNGSATV
jgi:hypothetical protein